MSLTVHSSQHDASSMINLVRDMREIGVETPDVIADEIKIYRDLSRTKEVRKQERERAIGTLYSVEAAEFARAAADLVELSLRTSVADETDALIVQASASRIITRVYDVAASWESTVVEKFNDAVEYFRLNELAQYLPNFADAKSFHVTSISRAQGEAIEQWRNASFHLDQLWSLYNRLNKVRGDTIIGPAGVDDMATNLLTACILGNPGSFGSAQSAAVTFVNAATGTDSAKAYGSLMPFVAPPLAGYELRLSTTKQAQSILQLLRKAA